MEQRNTSKGHLVRTVSIADFNCISLEYGSYSLLARYDPVLCCVLYLEQDSR